MSPALSRDDNPMSRLSRAGILLARLRWRQFSGVLDDCGSLMRVDADEAQAWRHALDRLQFPADWMRWCEPAQLLQQCGLPLSAGGIWLEQGAKVRPMPLMESLLNHEHIRLKACKVAGLQAASGGWAARAEDGAIIAEAPLAVIAAAADTPALLAAALPGGQWPKLAQVQRMGGQVGFFRAGDLPAVKSIVAGAGYFLPADAGVHVGGSTYTFDQAISQADDAGFREVAHKVADLLEISPDILLEALAQPDGWAGWRAAISDHLPVVGAADEKNSLWVAAAYGSRGLSWMTLAGEIMAAQLNNEPQVVERELLRGLGPR